MQDFAHQHPSTVSLGNPQMTGKKGRFHALFSSQNPPSAEMEIFGLVKGMG